MESQIAHERLKSSNTINIALPCFRVATLNVILSIYIIIFLFHIKKKWNIVICFFFVSPTITFESKHFQWLSILSTKRKSLVCYHNVSYCAIAIAKY